MKTSLLLSMLAGGAVALVAVGPMAAARAQSDPVPAVAGPAADHGDWTLEERENWLHDRLAKARDDGSLDRTEYERVRYDLDGIQHDEDRMRGNHDGGQLTDNETATLESRLDSIADQIHWLRENSFRRPW